MNSISFRLSVFIFLALPFFLEAQEFSVPPIRDHVNDTAGVLSASVEQQLNRYLNSVKKQTGVEMAVLTVESIGDTPLEEATLRVVESWQLGSATEDKGLLLFLAVQERKLRFEVGQGLEGSLTDLYSSRIIRDTMVPALKLGNYDQAVVLGVNSAIQRVAPELGPQQRSSTEDSRTRKKKSSILGTFIWILLFFIFSFGGMGRRRGRRGFGSVLDSGRFGGFGGGGFGGGGFGGGGGFSGGGASGGW